MKTEAPLLVAKGLIQHFKGVTALHNVDFSVAQGEIHGLVGQNGAGKSTLVKIISGALKPSGGTLTFAGNEIKSFTPENARRLGISIVPQHVDFFPYFTASENMFIDQLPTNNGLVNYKRLNDEALAWFKRFDLDLDPSAPMEELSFVQQKAVLILKALKDRSKMIILDEPTASLHLDEIGHLFALIRDFNAKGVTFLYISHHLDEIFEICQRVTILRDGQVQATKNVSEIDLKQLVRLMIGQEIVNADRAKRSQHKQVIFEVDGLSGDRVLRDVSFKLHRGEIVGILSNKGGGKDELVRLLFGFAKRKTGRVLYKGEDFYARSPGHCFGRRICLLPDDRHHDGLFLDKPIRENVTICSLPVCMSRLGFIRRSAETKETGAYIERLSITTTGAEQEVQFLSGGNQQKVLMAKILAADPELVVLDSPTVGVDIKARLEIHEIVSSIAGKGIAVILVTSDLDEILSLSDRILVLAKGRIVKEVGAGEPGFNQRDLGFIMEGGAANE